MALGQLQAEHPKIDVFQCDITARPDVLALVETIRDRYGKVDVLVNNAGIMERVNFLEETVSDERIAYEIAVNLTGPILLTLMASATSTFGSKPDNRHGHVGICLAPRQTRSDLLRD